MQRSANLVGRISTAILFTVCGVPVLIYAGNFKRVDRAGDFIAARPQNDSGIECKTARAVGEG